MASVKPGNMANFQRQLDFDDDNKPGDFTYQEALQVCYTHIRTALTKKLGAAGGNTNAVLTQPSVEAAAEALVDLGTTGTSWRA